jgi:hypothetical protein
MNGVIRFGRRSDNQLHDGVKSLGEFAAKTDSIIHESALYLQAGTHARQPVQSASSSSIWVSPKARAGQAVLSTQTGSEPHLHFFLFTLTLPYLLMLSQE